MGAKPPDDGTEVHRPVRGRVFILVLGVTAVIFPDYFRLLRPSVLKQLDPQVVHWSTSYPG